MRPAEYLGRGRDTLCKGRRCLRWIENDSSEYRRKRNPGLLQLVRCRHHCEPGEHYGVFSDLRYSLFLFDQIVIAVTDSRICRVQNLQQSLLQQTSKNRQGSAMADRDAWEKAESLSKTFAAVSIPLVLGVGSLLANQALEKSKTRDELLKQGIDVVFLDKSFEGRSPLLLFKPNGYYTSSRGKVFISYRRDDSAAYAGRVWDRLERDLGRDFLFMDVDAIPLGTNFSKVLHEKVDKCGVLLAMIGANWLDARDEHGNRRLDDPNDFVRIEIAAALQRNIPVIPILLDGAIIPKATQLPEDLKELALRNGMEIRHASFHGDMNRLIRELKGTDAQQSDPAVVQTVHLRAHTDDRATVSKMGTGNLMQLFHPR
jgi:TIR domain